MSYKKTSRLFNLDAFEKGRGIPSPSLQSRAQP